MKKAREKYWKNMSINLVTNSSNIVKRREFERFLK